jgi:hypothetical protein
MAKWPAFGSTPKGAKIDNDSSHNFTDLNSGGGPAMRNRNHIPDASKGGHFQSGQKQYASTSIHGGRDSSGNPASRGGMPSVGRQSFPSETRNPNGGGGVQERNNLPTSGGVRGGFGVNAHGDGMTNTSAPGHTHSPRYPQAHPQPGAGNIAGRASKRIRGHFDNDTKGRKATGTVGSYGDRAPVTSQT